MALAYTFRGHWKMFLFFISKHQLHIIRARLEFRNAEKWALDRKEVDMAKFQMAKQQK